MPRLARSPGHEREFEQTGELRRAFAEHLKWLLYRHRMSQTDLHKKSGVGRDSISIYTRALALPNHVSQEKMAQAFGISVDELMGPAVLPPVDSRPVSGYGQANDGALSQPAVIRKIDVTPITSGRVRLELDCDVPAQTAAILTALIHRPVTTP